MELKEKLLSLGIFENNEYLDKYYKGDDNNEEVAKN